MRLIDANALLSELTAKPMVSGAAKAAAMDLVRAAPTVGGWISVKDRLPKIGTLALVFGSAGAMTIARYIAGNEWLVPGVFSAITHWMPLPEPPKEETECNTD